MSERLDQIEQSLAATANICGSNARAIQANGEQIGELRNTVEAFIRKLDDEGLRVTLVTQIADDTVGDVAYLEAEQNRQDASIAALREDAIADRADIRAQAEADRQLVRDAIAAQAAQSEADRESLRAELAADRQRSDQRFDAQLAEIRAQGQQIRALLSALASTNGRVVDLEQAGRFTALTRQWFEGCVCVR